MIKPEEFGQYLQKLIESYSNELSIILNQYGIDEDPTPELLVAMYQEHGDQFASALAVLGEVPFESWPTLEHLEGQPLIDKIGSAFSGFWNNISSIKSSSSSSAPPAPAPDKPKWTTQKMMITGVVVVVVLTVLIFVIKKIKKS